MNRWPEGRRNSIELYRQGSSKWSLVL